MKRITIKEIHLLNFKGLRQADIVFDGRLTDISGTNGVGKSTVFDAFCWVLFGKNSADRKDFQIKTIDGATGEAIPRIPHEVKVTLTADGEEVTLRKEFVERWVKKRGDQEETFQGHTENRYWNDVPCTVAEYDRKVRSLCSEDLFKFITNPAYFATRKEDQMRDMLFEMAGKVSDEDVAGDNADFAALLGQLSNKTLEEYRKEIQSKKHAVQADIVSLPGRIDERSRDLVTPADTAKKEAELAEMKRQLAEVDTLIADKSAAYEAASEKRMEKVREAQALKEQLEKRKAEIGMKATAAYRTSLGEKRKLESDLASAKSAAAHAKLLLEDQQSLMKRYTGEREALLADWKRITAELKSGMSPEMDESQFVCPTCGRRYELDEIEAKRKEITERYIAGKLREKEENQQKGLALKAKMKNVETETARLGTQLGNEAQKVADIQSDPRLTAVLTEPDPSGDIQADPEVIRLTERIAALEEEAGQPLRMPDNSELMSARKGTSLLVEELQDFISRQKQLTETNEKNRARIAELEEELRARNNELARLEGIEYTIQEFSKAKTRKVEESVNAMFRKVRFKLFDTQVNGAEVECCVPLVDGVPYPDANTAGKVNAGLDIINAIVRKKGVSAPIFIDGAESVISLEDTESQLIRLTVTDEPELTVRHSIL